LNKGYTSEGFAEKVYHLHIRRKGDWEELRFRDYILAHPDKAAEYANLKQRLLAKYKYNRDAYTEAKTGFIEAYVVKSYTYPVRPYGKKSSVHYGDMTRFKKADEQSKLEIVSLEKIIGYTNDFLRRIGIEQVQNPVVRNYEIEPHNPRMVLLDYERIKRDSRLNNRRHIVWMKFTTDGFLGVVAASDDVNFGMPHSKKQYNDTTDGKPKSRSNNWQYNTSGIIIHHLNKKWDTNYVLVFPLANIDDKLRKNIECGIGNYLIAKGVPILDYYSHNF
jgi:hypothetical protein